MSFILQRATLALLLSAPQQPHPLPALDPALAGARMALDQARWTEAEGQLRLFLTQHPDSAEALYLLGATLFHENKPKASLATFTRAAQLATPSALDFRWIAMDYVLLNDYDDAGKWIARSAQENPADIETWYAMGRIRQTENRFNDAIESFQHALQLRPRWVKAEDNLGLAYEGLNQPEEAIKAYRQAIAWQQNDPHPSEQPLLNLAILLTDRNQLDEALALLQQAARLAPKDSKVHGALGKAYARRGALPQAQTELEQAVAGDPKNAGLHFQLGQVYRKQGLADRAAAELTEAAALERAGRH